MDGEQLRFGWIGNRSCGTWGVRGGRLLVVAAGVLMLGCGPQPAPTTTTTPSPTTPPAATAAVPPAGEPPAAGAAVESSQPAAVPSLETAAEATKPAASTPLASTPLAPPALTPPATTTETTPSAGTPPQPAIGAPGSEPAPKKELVSATQAVTPPQKSEQGKDAPKSGAAAAAPPRDPLFVDWPKPRYALVLTGQLMGYLEPCGCTGLVNQKGGLSRRHTMLQELTRKGWPLVPLDVGNQVHRVGAQAELKLQITSDALKKMEYRGVAIGPDDLRLSSSALLSQIAVAEGQSPLFLSANAIVVDESLMPGWTVVEIAGKKIGVASVLGAEMQKDIRGDEIHLKSPQEGLRAVLPKLQAARCDLLVLLAHAPLKEARQLAVDFPAFQVVVSAGTESEPAYVPETVPGTKSMLVHVGTKGMFAVVLGVFDDPRTPLRYQRIPLDARFGDSQEMLGLLAAYQEQLKQSGLEGLGIKPLPHPAEATFVGSEKCGECHTKAMEVWNESRHAHATETLVHPSERSHIPRHFDPECLSCHVTGWSPQQHFPYLSGYLGLEQTPLMKGVGCENCHGPGSLHVAAESNEGSVPADKQKSLREMMRLPLAQAEAKCRDCHDLDNSPDFHAVGAFTKYWEQVAHPGKD